MIKFFEANQLIKINSRFIGKIYPQQEIDIEKAENLLNVFFPLSYKLFLKEYGTLDLGGEEIYGLDSITTYEKYVYYNVVCATLDQRNININPPFSKAFVPIYDLGDGEKYCLDTSKINEFKECPVVSWYFGKTEYLYEDFGMFFLDTVKVALRSLEDEGKKINWLN